MRERLVKKAITALPVMKVRRGKYKARTTLKQVHPVGVLSDAA